MNDMDELLLVWIKISKKLLNLSEKKTKIKKYEENYFDFQIGAQRYE